MDNPPKYRVKRRWLALSLAGMLLLPIAGITASEADGHFQEARDYLAAGKLRPAIIELKNALQRDPGHIESRLLLAEAYLRTGEAAGAEKEFVRAGELGAAPPRWVPGYGQALLQQGKFQALLDRISVDDGLEPAQRADVLAMRGQALLALSQRESAAAAYEQALALDPKHAAARLGKIRLLILDRQFDTALESAAALVQDHPEHVEALVTKGELQRQLRQFDQAEIDFKRAIQLAPRTLQAYVGLGLVHVAQRKPDLALEDVAALRKQFPDVPVAGYIHALAAFQKGDMQTASEQLQQVLAASPEQLQAQLMYGVVNYAQGRYQLAEEYLTRIHTRMPGEPMVAKLLAAARMKLNQPDQAIAVLEPLTASHGDDAQLLALLGTAHLQAGDNNRGAEYMARAVELAPDQALLRAQLAMGQLASGDTPSAISELEQAVQLDQEIVQADVLLVMSYLRAGELDKALQAGARLRERKPDSPVAINLVGLVHLANKDFQAADKAFRDALAKDPNFLVARMNLARSALAQQDPDSAARHYQEVLDRQPGDQGAMLGLAALAKARGDAQAYEQWLTRARQANPGALAPILLMAELQLREGDPLKTTTTLNDLAEADQGRPEVLRLRGMALIQAGQFSNAIRVLEQLTRDRPDAIEGWFQLGRAQVGAGDLPAARASFERAVELDTKAQVPLLLIALAELEFKAGDPAAALAVAQRLQQQQPDNPAGYELAANAHRELNQPDNAIAALERAIQIAPSGQRARALAVARSTAGDPAAAAAGLQDWLEQQPGDVASRSALAMLQQQSGQLTAAIANYEAVIEAAPKHPVMLNNLAWLYLQQQDPRAEEIARRAYEAAPQKPEIIDTYGWVLFKLGKTEEGLRLLQQALVLAPRTAEIGLHVAEALHQAGRAAEARRVLDGIQREHPTGKWAEAAEALRSRLAN
jgi:putative PEP-CTERM system TPR-repeat lipoprotein